jgi:macrolide transport system ATP-binding/permease protein
MTDTVIEVQDPRARIRGDVGVYALRSVNLSIERGEFVYHGLVRLGRVTMMSILGCLDRPTGGRYLFEGVDVAQLSTGTRAHRSQRIGFVFRASTCWRAPALGGAAVVLSSDARRATERAERARHALELLGLGHRAETHRRNCQGGSSGSQSRARSTRPDCWPMNDRQPRHAQFTRHHANWCGSTANSTSPWWSSRTNPTSRRMPTV